MIVGIIFPKDSESLFFPSSKKAFGGASVQMYNLASYFNNEEKLKVYGFVNDYGKSTVASFPSGEGKFVG